jgi:hypothetical protein
VRALSKTLALLSIPTLLLTLLVLTVSPGQAEITKEEEASCWVDRVGCRQDCATKAKECGSPGSAGEDTCFKDCSKICDYKQSDCLRDADKSAPVPFKPKVQPKVTPGGAETPGAETPNVQPKGGIQQQP